MKKLNRLTGGLIATAAASAAIVSMTTTAAHAATTYTPTGGTGATNAITFVGTSVSFTDIAVAQTLTCTQFDLAGNVVNSGSSRAYNANGGTLSTLTSSGCSNPLAGATTVAALGNWGVTVTGDATGTVWPAKLTGVKAKVTAANCQFTVSGTVSGKFNDATSGTGAQRFTPNTGASGLVIDDGLPAGSGEIAPTGSMCVTLDLQPGDDISVGGYWTTNTNLDISNP